MQHANDTGFIIMYLFSSSIIVVARAIESRLKNKSFFFCLFNTITDKRTGATSLFKTFLSDVCEDPTQSTHGNVQKARFFTNIIYITRFFRMYKLYTGKKQDGRFAIQFFVSFFLCRFSDVVRSVAIIRKSINCHSFFVYCSKQRTAKSFHCVREIF